MDKVWKLGIFVNIVYMVWRISDNIQGYKHWVKWDYGCILFFSAASGVQVSNL